MAEPHAFPVGVESDLEFALIHGAILLVAVLVAKQLELVVASLLERSAPPPAGATLVIGKLPLAGDHDRVALVRGGAPALAELVRERAFVEGWLTRDENGLSVGAAVPREASLSTALRAALPFARAEDADLERASRAVAAKYLADNGAALEARGLLRTSWQRAVAVTVYALPALCVLAITVSRAFRAAELGESPAPAIAQLFFSALVFAALAKPRHRTDTGERYVRWLGDATHALGEDLANGGLRRREDFLLLVAAHGTRALGSSERARVWTQLAAIGEESEGGGGTG